MFLRDLITWTVKTLNVSSVRETWTSVHFSIRTYVKSRIPLPNHLFLSKFAGKIFSAPWNSSIFVHVDVQNNAGGLKNCHSTPFPPSVISFYPRNGVLKFTSNNIFDSCTSFIGMGNGRPCTWSSMSLSISPRTLPPPIPTFDYIMRKLDNNCAQHTNKAKDII